MIAEGQTYEKCISFNGFKLILRSRFFRSLRDVCEMCAIASKQSTVCCFPLQIQIYSGCFFRSFTLILNAAVRAMIVGFFPLAPTHRTWFHLHDLHRIKIELNFWHCDFNIEKDTRWPGTPRHLVISLYRLFSLSLSLRVCFFDRLFRIQMSQLLLFWSGTLMWIACSDKLDGNFSQKENARIQNELRLRRPCEIEIAMVQTTSLA